MKPPGGQARNTGLKHWYITAEFHVPDRNPRSKKRCFESKRASDQETDEIPAPEWIDVRDFVSEFTIPPDAVHRQIAAQIGIEGETVKSRDAGRCDFEKRAGLWIFEAELMKVFGVTFRKDNKVRLCESTSKS
jgi:hypothetical protein